MCPFLQVEQTSDRTAALFLAYYCLVRYPPPLRVNARHGDNVVLSVSTSVAVFVPTRNGYTFTGTGERIEQ